MGAHRPKSSQRRIRRSATTRALITFAVVSGALFLVDVGLNVASRRQVAGTNASATLLAYAVVVVVGQSQYAHANRADVTATSAWSPLSESGLDGVEQFWQLHIENVGRGAAIARKVSFEVDVPGEEPQMLRSVASLKAAALRDLKDGRDYYLFNLTPGFSLALNRSYLFFECRPVVIERFGTLTAVIEYETALGDVWEKRLSLLPNEGATPAA